MRKKFRKKKKYKFEYFLITIIWLIFMFILNFDFIYNNNLVKNILIDMSNNRINKTIDFINNSIFNNPVYILKSQLNYNKENTDYVNNFVHMESEKPKVYIYNSHQGEEYSIDNFEEHNITPTVLTASYILKDKLNNYGIKSIVEESNILEYMKENNLEHSGSYNASRYFLNKAINEYDTIELYIDLHRDSIKYEQSYININGMDCAKILFVIGLENEKYLRNLEITQELNNIINKKYPNLSRGILKKQGYGVNGIYNQDLKPNIILIEIGGYQNNIDEVNNTLSIIASVIKEYLDEKE